MNSSLPRKLISARSLQVIIQYIDIDFNKREYLFIISINDTLVRTVDHNSNIVR
jgi:hypothetical protein